MAKFYTTEEAAEKLGISIDEFKKRLKTEWTHLSAIRDGATLRYKLEQIEELIKKIAAAKKPAASDEEAPLKLHDDDDTDFISLSDSSGELDPVAPEKKGGKSGKDSSIKLAPGSGKTGKSKEPTEIAIDPKAAGKGGTRKIDAPGKGLGKNIGSSGEFELSLASDSSDEIELRLSDDSSDEIDLGPPPGKGAAKTGSGVNLKKPADSGISLEKSSDFELEVSDAPKSGKNKPAAKKPVIEDSSSEFELTLDDSDSEPTQSAAQAAIQGESKDIFETDFELPTIDEESGSEVAALSDETSEDSSSDFDIALNENDATIEEDESASQVVAIEESKGSKKRIVAVDEELDELDEAVDLDDEDAVRPAAKAAAPAKANWGVLPALVLLPCVLIMCLAGLMAYELLHSMWGYQQATKPAAPLVRYVAELIGGELPKE